MNEPVDKIINARPFKLDKMIQNLLDIKTKRQGLGSLTSVTRFSSLLWNTMWKKLQLESHWRDLLYFNILLLTKLIDNTTLFLWVFLWGFKEKRHFPSVHDMFRKPHRRVGCNDKKFPVKHVGHTSKLHCTNSLKGDISFCDNKQISGRSDF